MFITEQIMAVFSRRQYEALMAFALDLASGWATDGIDTSDIDYNINLWQERARAHDYSEAHVHALFASGWDIGARLKTAQSSDLLARQEAILKRWSEP